MVYGSIVSSSLSLDQDQDAEDVDWDLAIEWGADDQGHNAFSDDRHVLCVSETVDENGYPLVCLVLCGHRSLRVSGVRVIGKRRLANEERAEATEDDCRRFKLYWVREDDSDGDTESSDGAYTHSESEASHSDSSDEGNASDRDLVVELNEEVRVVYFPHLHSLTISSGKGWRLGPHL